MLYGIDSRAHSATKQGLADKTRYDPWSGQLMSGRIELNWNGRDITIERTSTKRAAFRQFRAYDTHSGLDIPELTGENCGQILLGVEKDVFLRSGFIRLTDMPVTQSEALRRRLNALVTTGDESGAADKLAQQLRDLKNECRANRVHGLLPQAESQRDGLMHTLSRLNALKAEANSLDNLLLQQERAHQTLLARQAAQNEEESRRRQEALSQLQLLRQRRADTEARRRAMQAPDIPAYAQGLSPADGGRHARKDQTVYWQACAERRSPLRLLLSALPALLGLLFLSLPNKILGGCLWLVFVVCGISLISAERRRQKRAAATADALAEKYSGIPAEEWESWLVGLLDARAEYIRQLQQQEAELSGLDRDIAHLEQGLTHAPVRGDTGQDIRSCELQLHQTQLQRGRCQGQIEALGDEQALLSQLSAVEDRIGKLNQAYAALELAQQTLAKATAQLQSRFAPRITHRASELFERLTGGRYRRLSLTDSLELHTCAESEETLRSILWRSDGTADQLYLALRLAVAGELTPEAPLVLDDALVRFDDDRLRRAMEVLREEAAQKQVILFTCQSRESNL